VGYSWFAIGVFPCCSSAVGESLQLADAAEVAQGLPLDRADGAQGALQPRGDRRIALRGRVTVEPEARADHRGGRLAERRDRTAHGLALEADDRLLPTSPGDRCHSRSVVSDRSRLVTTHAALSTDSTSRSLTPTYAAISATEGGRLSPSDSIARARSTRAGAGCA
jgi:hypothetical protein